MNGKILMNGLVLLLGASILGSVYISPGPLPPQKSVATSSIPHLSPDALQLYQASALPTNNDAVIAAQQVQVTNLSTLSQKMQDNMQKLDDAGRALDAREMQHYMLLDDKIEIDEAKVLQTLKVIGWMVAIAEAIHLWLSIRQQLIANKGVRLLRRRRKKEMMDGKDC